MTAVSPVAVVVMGVCGCGKSTIGQGIATALGAPGLVRAVLDIEEVFGADLRNDAALRDQLTAAVTRIAEAGVYAVLSS